MSMSSGQKRLLEIIRDHHQPACENIPPWPIYYLVWREVEKEFVEVVVEFMKLMNGNMVIPGLLDHDRKQFARLAEVHLCHQLRELMPRVLEPCTLSVQAMFSKSGEKHDTLARYDKLHALLKRIKLARDYV